MEALLPTAGLPGDRLAVRIHARPGASHHKGAHSHGATLHRTAALDCARTAFLWWPITGTIAAADRLGADTADRRPARWRVRSVTRRCTLTPSLRSEESLASTLHRRGSYLGFPPEQPHVWCALLVSAALGPSTVACAFGDERPAPACVAGAGRDLTRNRRTCGGRTHGNRPEPPPRWRELGRFSA